MLRLVDLIQHRYGWTDEVVFNLPYTRFLDVCETAVEQVRENSNSQYRYAAFTAFLLNAPENMSFSDYLETLGLGQQSNTPQKAVTSEEALSKANSILEKFNQG